MDEILSEDPDMAGRVARFIESGTPPHGYLVSADTLRSVVQNVEGVAGELKSRVLVVLESDVIKGQTTLDAFQLGIAIGAMTRDFKHEEIWPIIRDLKDLNKLPFVSVPPTDPQVQRNEQN